ncbi:MAG: hypothetical protein CMO43_05030 [Verrucomicrobiales bacterium]|jgi:hypothetical protein|nr:hypothetical protein [Verrucomicrobiales bacterium]MDP6677484.1 hypothetical protein [Verrucomicrobiota bacterium]MDP6752847.1 hypothetical protein [Verrucomicrobiota bacterium]
MSLLLQSTMGRVYWAILVYGVLAAVVVYIIRKQLKNPDNDPVKVIVKWAVTLAMVVFMIYSTTMVNDRGLLLVVFIFLLLPGSVFMALWWAPKISEWMASPITNALTGDSRISYNKPEYGVANARRNRGQYVEAVEAVDEELTKHPGNFDGLMLKASIQAENLGDLEAATETVQEAIEGEEQLSYRLPVALNKMADWQLAVAGDPDAARRTLRQIREALPESQAAQFAAQRLASLDSSEETAAAVVDFNESYQKLVEESAAKDDFTSPLELPKAIESNQQQAGEKALAACLRRVALHPDSVSNREELAALYLDHANQPPKAAEQYDHLLALPGTTIHQKTAWLNKIADIQVKSGESHETVRATLERVIALDPKAAPAARAQQRISYLNIELRGANRKTTKLQLGSYEEDIGLKS